MIIIDDFITDRELLSKIQKDEDFWKEGYRWWSGWWNSNVPMQTRHELIETIWRTNCPPQLIGTDLEGFEHWTGILSKDKIIKIIRSSKSPDEAKDKLLKNRRPEFSNFF